MLQSALYKSGKQWITAAIATIAVSTGIILGGWHKLILQTLLIISQLLLNLFLTNKQTIIVITINKHKP
ncbi:KxYKxGKxW signal peptide domain-containing protein [Limosilactobacillus reuteri subsp. suis]|uniref:KxYKxGKxW signal peptide domain-containing protein n=1 Tax=Limosilactobacillus reuteri TaxID=1598 RepID=UPI003995A258